MARRKKIKSKYKRHRTWSEARINTGPTVITSPRLGASASLQSVRKGVPIPELREGEGGLSEPRVAKHLVYVKMFHERLEYMRITVLDRSPISCLYLLFRGRQWMWMRENYVLHERRLSIVYETREHAYLVLSGNNICWKHQENINVDVRNDDGSSSSNRSNLGLYALLGFKET